jgi:hypothetical protein
MGEIESGFKWWMRYVIVPIIGGGGIIAIVIAVIDRTQSSPAGTKSGIVRQELPPLQPTALSEPSQSSVPRTPQKEQTTKDGAKPNHRLASPSMPNKSEPEFYVMEPSTHEYETKTLPVKIGDTITLHWNVPNPWGELWIQCFTWYPSVERSDESLRIFHHLPNKGTKQVRVLWGPTYDCSMRDMAGASTQRIVGEISLTSNESN